MNADHFDHDRWRRAAGGLKARLGTDYRNHRMLSDPWARAAHSMVQGWRNIASQGRLDHVPKPRRRITTWNEAAHNMKHLLNTRRTPTATGHQDVAVLGQSPAACESSVHRQGSSTKRRPRGRVTTGNVLQLLESQQYRCALTGRRLTPDTASLDHVVPVRNGGEHAIENTQVLHKDVNRAKTTLSNEEFIQLCREVVDHTSAATMLGDAS